jgi:hypothetical protein
MQRARATQRHLFEEVRLVPIVRLSPSVQSQLRWQLVHWLKALARAIEEERPDEQNQR